jgi:hypothetical protein
MKDQVYTHHLKDVESEEQRKRRIAWERLMGTRMNYLQTLLKSLRSEISTHELATNPKLLSIMNSMDFHLKQMELLYVQGPNSKNAI